MRDAEDLGHHPVQQRAGQPMAMAHNIIAPLTGQMHGREA